MLLLDLAHLRMPALCKLMQAIINLAPHARRARHLAVHRRVKQTPQALRMKGGEKGLQNEHEERKTKRGTHSEQYANDPAQYREQREGHERTRPDDIHELADRDYCHATTIGRGLQALLASLYPLPRTVSIIASQPAGFSAARRRLICTSTVRSSTNT